MFKLARAAVSAYRACQTLPSAQSCPLQLSRRFLCTPAPEEPALDIAEITNGDAELEHKLKVIMLEVDVLRQEGKLVPEEEYMRTKHWKELMTLSSISARRRYLQFLFKNAKRDENQKAKVRQRLEERSSTKPVKKENETIEEFASQYDLQHNNMFLRVYDTTINQVYNNGLIQAMQFGQKIVVDCGYYDEMTKRETLNCSKQLMLTFADNRAHKAPYDLHYCNVNKSTELIQAFHRYISTMYEPWFPLHTHESSYLDLFPKEQLVYLTPHCRNELIEYDHDAIYIIGGIVDKVNNNALSLAKAKREGLKMAKLPLDRYLCWGTGGGKNLTLNQIILIMLDMKETGDWKHALRHVPKRKLQNFANTTSTITDRYSAEAGEEKRTRGWSPGNNRGLLEMTGREGRQRAGSDKENKRNFRSIMYD